MVTEEAHIDGMQRICICKGIPKSKIVEAIKKGARSIGLVGRLTGSGSGSCHGRRCTGPIDTLITEDRERRQAQLK